MQERRFGALVKFLPGLDGPHGQACPVPVFPSDVEKGFAGIEFPAAFSSSSCRRSRHEQIASASRSARWFAFSNTGCSRFARASSSGNRPRCLRIRSMRGPYPGMRYG